MNGTKLSNPHRDPMKFIAIGDCTNKNKALKFNALLKYRGLPWGLSRGDYPNQTRVKFLALEWPLAGSLYLFCLVSFGGSTPMARKNSFIQVVNDWNLTLLVTILWFHLMA